MAKKTVQMSLVDAAKIERFTEGFDPILSVKDEDLEKIENLSRNMTDYLFNKGKVQGVGLSACQVGIPLSFFVWNQGRHNEAVPNYSKSMSVKEPATYSSAEEAKGGKAFANKTRKVLKEEAEKEAYAVYRTVINPFYYGHGKRAFNVEGCLSYPKRTFAVSRYKKIRAVWYVVKDGKLVRVSKDLKGEAAFVFQHETDHCFGITVNLVGREIEIKKGKVIFKDEKEAEAVKEEVAQTVLDSSNSAASNTESGVANHE